MVFLLTPCNTSAAQENILIFYYLLDRTPASEHLPLAWTHSTDDDESLLMTRLKELRKQFLRGERETENQENY